MDVFGGVSQHAHNVRYQIAKGQVDQLFLKWVGNSTTDRLISSLIDEIKGGGAGQNMQSMPSPLFITKMQKAPGSPTGNRVTPPRSPSAEKYGLGRTMSPKQSNSLLEQFRVNPQSS